MYSMHVVKALHGQEIENFSIQQHKKKESKFPMEACNAQGKSLLHLLVCLGYNRSLVKFLMEKAKTMTKQESISWLMQNIPSQTLLAFQTRQTVQGTIWFCQTILLKAKQQSYSLSTTRSRIHFPPIHSHKNNCWKDLRCFLGTTWNWFVVRYSWFLFSSQSRASLQ